MVDFSKLDHYMVIADPFDENEDIIVGYVFTEEDVKAFLFDVEQLARRHNGVGFDELLEHSEFDESGDAALRASMRIKTRGRDVIDVAGEIAETRL